MHAGSSGERVEIAEQLGGLLLPALHEHASRREARRQRFERSADARELLRVRRGHSGREQCGRALDHDGDRRGIEREAVIEVADAKAAGVEGERDLVRRDGIGELLPENRDEHASLEPARGRVPVDVEPARIARCGAVGEEIVPEGIVRAHAHVVRHDVEHEAHVVRAQIGDQRVPGRVAAELRIESRGVDHIVAVRASRARAQHG